MKMAALYWLVFLGSLCIGTVESAGYLGRMPHHGGSCYYEDIMKAHFSYDEETCRRPEKWCCLHKCWTTCGSTRRQSPINLDTSEARRTNANLKLYNIHKRVPATIHNSGHAPHFDVDDNKDITLKLKNIDINKRWSKDRYIFHDIHIHLGKKENKGSEHSIDGKFYPMEAHMVFYNSRYRNITKAKSKDDGLVVIGVMIQPEHVGVKMGKINCEDFYKEIYKFLVEDLKNKVNKKHGDDDDDDDNNDDDDDDNDDDANEGNENKYDEEDDKDDEYEGDDDNERSKREIRTKSCCHSNYWDYKYREHDEEYFSKKCYEGKGKCKVRFARTLSCLMEKYYEEIKEYHEQDNTPNGNHGPRCDNCGKKPSDYFITNFCEKNPVKNHSNTVVECGITPADVLPYDQRFYTYPGSLTTPPCYESVQWIVYKCPIKVSRKAFKALQRVEDTEKNPLKEHGVRRPLQKNRYKVSVSKNF